jgi:murein DD-endopeptidase MepM/ murein hydrolase activator NlpD
MEKKSLYILRNLFSILIILLALGTGFFNVNAATESQLRTQIADNLKKQAELEAQIAEYSKLYSATSKEAQSLQKALKELELSQKKLEADLSYTTKKIQNANLTIDDLRSQIYKTEADISVNALALRNTLVNLNSAENDTSVEKFFTYSTLSDAWDDVTLLSRYQSNISNVLSDFKDLKTKLDLEKLNMEGQRKQLVTYQKQLTDKKTVVEYNQKEKDKLLADTKNKEYIYKSTLEEKQRQKDLFEKELFDYESQLRILFDPNSVPGEHPGILSWPLSDVFITQFFGKTVSAKRLYVSGTHGGIDFRSAIGTKVMAASSGTVTDTESVKIKQGCQYGKWVLIKHPNGLSTIYGHLSQVSVKPGDTVMVGDTLGYSGQTGYSTGPHLHFGVYATAGLRIVDSSALGSVTCRGIKTVAADPKAYLDPMSYLPTYKN